MLRRTDGFGFLGIVMLVAGITLYFTGSFHRISRFTGWVVLSYGSQVSRWS